MQIQTQHTLRLTSVLHAIAETGTQAGNSLGDGSCPTAVLLCADNDHRLDLHGAHSKKEEAVGRCVQPQCSGAGWSTARDGQHAQSPPRGKTNLSTAWGATRLTHYGQLKCLNSGGGQVLCCCSVTSLMLTV